MGFPGLLGHGFGHAKVSRKRKLAALIIAGCADLVQGVLFPFVVEGGFSPVEWVVDIAAALGLLLVVGLKARLVVAFVAELVPGLDLFPTWTALVLSLPVEEVSGSGLPAREVKDEEG